jgi:hypothetical protein
MADLIQVPLEGKIPYDASKWLKIQALLDKREFEALLSGTSARLYDMEGEVFGAEQLYGAYADALKEGLEPKSAPFAWMWTKTTDALYLLDIFPKPQVKIRKPVVQISHHQMNYLPEDNTFRSNLYGPDTLFWGLQFSFPQLFQDPVTKEVFKVNDPTLFPNLELFKYLQKWIRENTIPTPFEQVNAPQRIGKIALTWIKNHPHLLKKGLRVKLSSIFTN